jgi:hypothetical protein
MSGKGLVALKNSIRYNKNVGKSKKGVLQMKISKKNKKKWKSILIAMGVILILLIIFISILSKKKTSESNGHEVTTVSKSSLEKVLDISELSTLDYTYNAIANVYDEDNTTVKYYVAYKGTVRAGIDFDKIEVSEPDENKKILITIPDVEIQDTTVDMGSLDYIFTKSEYNKETVSQEAYQCCQEDLAQRAEETEELKQMAKDNAITSVQALIQPWLDQLEEGYTVEIQ